MVDMKKMKKKIQQIEKNRGCSIYNKSMKELIVEVEKRYRTKNFNKKKFKNLVEDIAEKLELNYNYCRVAFSYFSSNKKNGNKGEKFIRNQMFFSFYKPVVRY